MSRRFSSRHRSRKRRVPVVDGRPLGGEARLLLRVPGQQVRAALRAGPAGCRPPRRSRARRRPSRPGRPTRSPAARSAPASVRPGAERLGLGAAVERVDGAAGEHVGPAHEVRAQVAPDHQHLERRSRPTAPGRRARASPWRPGGSPPAPGRASAGDGGVGGADGGTPERVPAAGGGAPGTGAPLD